MTKKILIALGLLAIALLVVARCPVWARVVTVILLSLFIGFGTYFATNVYMHRYYHGTMNVGVWHPYRDLVTHLNNLTQQKEYDKLATALQKMENQSTKISGVWLHGDTLNFRNFVDEIIGE